jgi:hypothetical protein
VGQGPGQGVVELVGPGHLVRCCSDIEALRAQERLFGSVPSDSTLYRTFRQISPATLGGVWEAMAGIRARVWRRSSVTNNDRPVILDIAAAPTSPAPTWRAVVGAHVAVERHGAGWRESSPAPGDVELVTGESDGLVLGCVLDKAQETVERGAGRVIDRSGGDVVEEPADEYGEGPRSAAAEAPVESVAGGLG